MELVDDGGWSPDVLDSSNAGQRGALQSGARTARTTGSPLGSIDELESFLAGNLEQLARG